MIERSMTSDAGRFKGSKSRLAENDSDEEEEEEEEEQKGKKGVKRADGQVPTLVWRKVVRPVAGYATSIVALALENGKPLLGWALLIYALAAAMVFAGGFLTHTINTALSPICRLPFTSALPFCPAHHVPELKGEAQFSQLMQAQDAFQDVLATTAVGTNLPLHMKRSEAGIRDLKHVVQYSTLPSKNELVFEFSGFIDTARQASHDLSHFNSRIGRAVDHILSTNRWTLNVINAVAETEAARGGIARFMSNNLNIFAPFLPVSSSRNVLLDQYLRHTDAVEEQIVSLITEAQALRDMLDNLEGRLDVISEIVTRDNLHTESNKDELFAFLWTKLGGNRGSVQKLNQQLELLRNVGQHRRAAWGHVTTTLLKLQAIQHNLEDLRERVALPETVGTDRVPLEVHIENIHLGIERLEQQRDVSRQVEAEKYQRIIGKADERERKILAAG